MKPPFKIIAFALVIFIVSCKQKPLEFVKLNQFSKIDTLSRDGKIIMFKTDCYIVDNYGDNLQTEKTIDSFAYKNRALDLNKYEGYEIVVYKSSDITNNKNLKQDPKDFDDYTFDNDMIYIYRWSGGIWSGKSKYHKRETVEARPMIRED